MIKEQIVIAPTPMLIALKNSGAQKSDLLDVDKLLSIVSYRDVLFYYIANTQLGNNMASITVTDDAVETALKDLVKYTHGVTDHFTTPSWVAFLEKHDQDIRFELNSGRTLYEYLTGECYDVDAIRSGTATVYETKTCVLTDQVVCVMVVPDIDHDRDDMVMTKKLFGQVLYSLNTINADMSQYHSLYKGYCDMIVNGAVVERSF